MADFGKIRDEGEQANLKGQAVNPYAAGTSSAAAWQFGWTDAEEDRKAREGIADQRAEEMRLWTE